ncbi:hypothetical protein NKH18_11745 [Streptomyces sp. M10(2022)]
MYRVGHYVRTGVPVLLVVVGDLRDAVVQPLGQCRRAVAEPEQPAVQVLGAGLQLPEAGVQAGGAGLGGAKPGVERVCALGDLLGAGVERVDLRDGGFQVGVQVRRALRQGIGLLLQGGQLSAELLQVPVLVRDQRADIVGDLGDVESRCPGALQLRADSGSGTGSSSQRVR